MYLFLFLFLACAQKEKQWLIVEAVGWQVPRKMLALQFGKWVASKRELVLDERGGGGSGGARGLTVLDAVVGGGREAAKQET